MKSSLLTSDSKSIERTYFNRLYLKADGQAPALESDVVSAIEQLKPLRERHVLADSTAKFWDLVAARVPGKRVLEVGCGLGDLSIQVAKFDCQVVGVDVSNVAIEIAKRRATELGVADRVTFLEADIESIECAGHSFDVVLNHEVFSSLDIHKVIPILHRLLANGGIIIGKETLGHNPIFNLKRRINVIRGRRTRWAADHIFRLEMFDELSKYFRLLKEDYFHLFSPFTSPLATLPGGASLVRILQGLDRRILQYKALHRMAFKVVFELEKVAYE